MPTYVRQRETMMDTVRWTYGNLVVLSEVGQQLHNDGHELVLRMIRYACISVMGTGKGHIRRSGKYRSHARKGASSADDGNDDISMYYFVVCRL